MTQTKVERFLVALSESERRAGKRFSFDERKNLIYEYFPNCRLPVGERMLSDVDVLGMILRDIMKTEAQVPGKDGRRPMPTVQHAHDSLRKYNGEDHTVLPFPEAFKVLTRGASSRQLAQKTGISPSQILRLRRGECDPTPREMDLIAKAFKKEPSYFVEFRTAFILAMLGARLERVPEATIGLYRKVTRI